MLNMSKGGFKPAPPSQCDKKVWHNHVRDLEGHPLPAVTIVFTTFKKGGLLQHIFCAMEIEKGPSGKFQAPEMDTNHSLFHMHPNGHHPPSGKRIASIPILRLDGEEDLRTAMHWASKIVHDTVLKILLNKKGWGESNVSRCAAESAHSAVAEIGRVPGRG